MLGKIPRPLDQEEKKIQGSISHTRDGLNLNYLDAITPGRKETELIFFHSKPENWSLMLTVFCGIIKQQKPIKRVLQ